MASGVRGSRRTMTCASMRSMRDAPSLRLVTRSTWTWISLCRQQELLAERTLATPHSTRRMLLAMIKPTRTRLICRDTSAMSSVVNLMAGAKDNRCARRTVMKSFRGGGGSSGDGEGESTATGRAGNRTLIVLCHEWYPSQ